MSNEGKDPDSSASLFLREPLKQRKPSSWNPGKLPLATKKPPFSVPAVPGLSCQGLLHHDSLTVPMGVLKLLTLKSAGLEKALVGLLLRQHGTVRRAQSLSCHQTWVPNPVRHLLVMSLGLFTSPLSFCYFIWKMVQ